MSEAKDFLTDEEMTELENKDAPDFISDEEMNAFDQVSAQVLANKNKSQGPVQTFLDRAVNTLLMGYAPEAEAALENITEIGGPEYIKRRDELSQILEREGQDNPLSAMAGTGAGIAGAMVLPIKTLKVPKIPIPMATPIAQGAVNVGTAAAMVGASNPGSVEGELSPLQPEERIQNVENAFQDPLSLGLMTAAGLAPSAGAMVEKFMPEGTMATRAMGVLKKDVKKAIRTSPNKDVTKNIDQITDYALQKGVVRPLSGTEGMLEKVRVMKDLVGSDIGKLRKKAESAVKKWTDSSPDDPEVLDYLDKNFHPMITKQQLLNQADEMFADPDYAEKVKALVSQKMDALNVKYGAKDIPMETLSKLKSAWNREIEHGKEMADFSVREDAFNLLKDAVDTSIDNEIKYADRYLKGKDLIEHGKLKSEYGKLKLMNRGFEDKLSKERTSSFTKLTNATPVQSTLANMGHAPMRAAVGGLMASQNSQNMPKLEGFPSSMTASVAEAAQAQNLHPEVMLMQIQTQIEKDPQMSNMEKANRLNLLNKYGRIYIGQ